MANEIVRSEPLAQQVYKVLRDGILNGRFQPGEKLVETKLAAELKTSRSPVREALRQLCTEQLACQVDGAIRVFNPSYEDYLELYELRLTIESMAARLAASRMTETQWQRLLAVQQETAQVLQVMDAQRLVALNTEFHAEVVAACQNRRLQRVFAEVSTLIEYYCRLVLHINQMQTNILAEHQRVIDALARRDADAAYAAMYEHIQRDTEVIERAMREAGVESTGAFQRKGNV
ncbi:MAG: GntR family transcriptional regulator [Alicyclobacillus macrosporangiidus]|uniref:GntR family transcriptional regulator n=1 Tax=Alicyclobacillus macrosporangiidus TaxID=392015 RepID=UPI0026F08AC8|nr:GntR family transcriptional regulator [Alicyclobacillus macrosporangiidus]MCL6600000.1 GntR family transcriptional regulator [Alicyclobacillus macrosporangiidus]